MKKKIKYLFRKAYNKLFHKKAHGIIMGLDVENQEIRTIKSLRSINFNYLTKNDSGIKN